MGRNLGQLRNDFMNVVGSISVDELASNQNVIQAIKDIYEELTKNMRESYDKR